MGNRRPDVSYSAHRGIILAISRCTRWQRGDPQRHRARLQLALEVADLVEDGHRQHGDGRGVQHERAWVGGIHRSEDPAVGTAHVGGVQRAVEAQDQEAADRLGVLPGHAHIGAIRRQLQLRHPNVVELVEHEEERQHDADGDGEEQAEALP